MAQALWWHGEISAFRIEDVGEREHAFKAYRDGSGVGQSDLEGKSRFFKITGLKTDDLRSAVIHTRQKPGTSERRTCKTLGVTRSTQHYKSAPRDDDEGLRLALIRLAKQYGRYGYPLTGRRCLERI